MAKRLINKEELTKIIAEKTGSTQAETRRVIESFQEEARHFLKSRGKVVISGFGNFYIYQRKSRTIKQIRTSKNRLIISQKCIKFKASQVLKQYIKDNVGKTKSELSSTPAKAPKISVQTKAKIEKEQKIAPPEKLSPNQKIFLGPVSQFPHVSKERFEQLLKQRLKNTNAKGEFKESRSMESSSAGKLILSLIKIAQRNKRDKINFILESGLARAFILKPKKQIGKLPYTLCREFFEDELELHDLDIPQHRHKLIACKNNNRGIINISAHSLPLEQGASVMIEFKIR